MAGHQSKVGIRRCGGLIGIAALLLALVAGRLGAEPDHGLMWNRTGLPLVFPLQVKTEAGQDLFLTLTDAATGVPALGAFIEGGRFFQVLAPPGRFFVRFDPAEGLAGPVHNVVKLEAPLAFAVRDFSSKAGHRVDLTPVVQGAAPIITPLATCRGRRLTAGPSRQPPFDNEAGYATRLLPPGDVVKHPDAAFDVERLTEQDAPARPTAHAPYVAAPKLRSRRIPC